MGETGTAGGDGSLPGKAVGGEDPAFRHREHSKSAWQSRRAETLIATPGLRPVSQ